MMIRIEESGMLFEFEEEKVFPIENSNLYRKIGEGIKSVEFIVSLKENEFNFIEAKSSSPRPAGDNKQRFDKFVDEISDKFLHSFNLYLSAVLHRNLWGEIPQNLLVIDNETAKFKFILIIKGHQIEWLQPLKDAIYRNLLYHNKIWRSSVILMNEEMARDYNLIKEW